MRIVPPRIMAVAFDLDNTLVDSCVDFREMRRRLIHYIRSQQPQTEEIDESKTTLQLIEAFRANVSDQRELSEHMAKLHGIMDQVEMESLGRTRPLGDVRAVLSELKRMGIKVGLLTRSCERYARAALGSIGCLDAFDAMACRTPGEPVKPDPTSLVNLARKLGVGPSSIMVVGDHAMDAECARAAGALFAGVARGSRSPSALREANPVALLEDLRELPKLIREINANDREKVRPGRASS